MANLIHDAPWLRLRDHVVFTRFINRFGIGPQGPHGAALIERVAGAFRQVPYENLTKILKADAVVGASSAMRHPDEVLRDYLTWGTGGTCFSLTAAMVAVLDALGVAAFPILADRRYGPDTHCGLIVAGRGARPLLLDPGFLLFAPVPVPAERATVIDTEFNRMELRPLDGGSRLELYTIVKNNRKLRLTFRVEAVSDGAFGRAWERSFAFEMMTYPVLTSASGGRHRYLQGNVLIVRDSSRTERIELTEAMRMEFITGAIKINKEIASRALEIVKNGLGAAPYTR